MSLARQDRLAIGRARARLNEAIRQLELALVRGDDEQEACLRVGFATVAARDGHDICRRLFLAMDKQEAPWDESQEGIEADRPEDLPVPANADKRYEELDGG